MQAPSSEIIDNLQDLGHLGSGSNAFVKKAIYNGKLVAVKLFYKKGENREEDYLREVSTLKKVSHDNIIKLIKSGKWSEKNDLFNCMIIEFADTGSLYHVLYERREIQRVEYTLGHGISWLKQCADAINYLHSFKPKPILHRDLKPLNLLLMNGGVLLKVCDFGTATNLKTIMTVDRGSPCWVAPESMSGDNYDEKCDIYSYSIITWEVLVRLNPYFDMPNANSGAIMYMVASRNMRPQKIANCPRLFQLFFESCWSADPRKRPSMEFIYQMMSKLDAAVNNRDPIKPIVNLHASSSETSLSHSASSTSLRKNRNTVSRGSISSNDMTQETVKNDFNFTSSTERLNKTSDFLIIKPDEQQDFVRNTPKRLSFNNQPYDIIKENEVAHNNNNSPVRRPAPLPPPTGKPNHRRSRSYGETSFLATSASLNYQESYLAQLNIRVESFIHNPLPPVKNHQDSLGIYRKHCDLIKYDNALDQRVKYLDDELKRLRLKEQQLSEFCDLVKKKELLIAGNARLKNKLVQELHVEI